VQCSAVHAAQANGSAAPDTRPYPTLPTADTVAGGRPRSGTQTSIDSAASNKPPRSTPTQTPGGLAKHGTAPPAPQTRALAFGYARVASD
jgi:hypothetical protein